MFIESSQTQQTIQLIDEPLHGIKNRQKIILKKALI